LIAGRKVQSRQTMPQFTVRRDGVLVVPVVRDADRGTLAELSATSRDLVGRARARELALRLTSNHRIVYGAEAARFLGRVAALLEDSAALA
jgi:pyruvate/2-oxoglutarate dehydrogenase complex dihydrolipoamide acyltransferase (E2) component